MNNFHHLTDQTLYHLCKTYGSRALEWRRKFTGLLPEVNKRKLYEKKGFPSILVFAKKLAGLSEEQVRLVLNLEKRFEKMPVLQSLLVNGEVSVNKLARVVSIASIENQEFLATQVQVLSKSVVDTLVRDEKFWAGEGRVGGHQNFPVGDGLLEPEIRAKSLPGQTLEQNGGGVSGQPLFFDGKILNLSAEVQQKLLDLQQKGIDINDLLLEFLKKREEEIADKKEQIAQKVLQREEQEITDGKEVSKYMSVEVRGVLGEEFGRKCSIKNCQKAATEIHHTQRFSIGRSHNPHYLAPLCKEHHELAHAVDLNYQEARRCVRK